MIKKENICSLTIFRICAYVERNIQVLGCFKLRGTFKIPRLTVAALIIMRFLDCYNIFTVKE
jgi:hypothetical protein